MKKAAVIEGGYSKEKGISIKSAKTVFDNLDRNKFDPTRVLIDENEWTAYDDEGKYSIDKNDFSYTKNGTKLNFDYAFIVIHGSPGEDGKLQGYLDMVGVPYNTSSSAITALTFQKFHCNQFLKNFGINVPEAILIKLGEEINNQEILKKVGLPCFVKPTEGGSSFGVTKVKKESELAPAIKKARMHGMTYSEFIRKLKSKNIDLNGKVLADLAFNHGSEVIVEENIKGREITCGIYREDEKIKALPLTEIISENEYFDYDAKYNGKSQEVTPADLTDFMIDSLPRIGTATQLQSLTKEIYGILGMKGIVRMDYILNDRGDPFLIEINSVPGMSKESIVPKMVKSKNINLKSFLNGLIY